MRVALFGGTFDPPHRGHIAVAKTAADAFDLDQVLFAPTGKQPLKLEAAATPFALRLELVAAACESDPRFSVSKLDAPREDGKPNYTVDTLAALRELRPNERLFNLVGADSFLTLRQWKDPDKLLELAEWIVVTRPGYPLGQHIESSALGLTEAQEKHVHFLDYEIAISATELRGRLALGQDCDDLLDPSTAAYIKLHALYLNGIAINMPYLRRACS